MGKFETLKSLNGNWRLYIEEHSKCSSFSNAVTDEDALKAKGLESISGTVPGNFELDMQRAGLIPDPFFGKNPLELRKYENRHLWYATEFDYDGNDPQQAYLLFEGVDTFADIYLNGVLVGSCDNMLISHEYHAQGIKNGKNEILVHIKPTTIEARKYKSDMGAFYHMRYNAESLPVRKAAHSFGWDIAPRIISGGMWRDVTLAERKRDCITDIYLQTAKLDGDTAQIALCCELDISGDYANDYSLTVSGVCGDSSFSHREAKMWYNRVNNIFELKNPRLWWPRDMGAQDMYRVTAELFYKGECVDRKEFDFGVRTIRLERTEVTDKSGSGEFCFYVNGHRFFARGTNWVPLDAFHSRDAARLDRALEMLKDVNCNMVRCWGGNVYEDHPFFDFCDKNGILVWQDFAMGCNTYPQDDDFARRLGEEAEHVVKKYRQHPSIALWAGDNECDLANAYWSMPPYINPASNRLTRKVLPEVITRLDPWRDFLPSSPYVGEEAFKTGNDDLLPENHLWGPRDYYKSDFYMNSSAHFASETGYHGCPSVESIKKFIPADKLWPWQDNDEWQLHATCLETGPDVPYHFRNGLMANQIEVLFGHTPQNLEEFAVMSQYSQAEANKFLIERFRATKWRRTGLIWWNLIDCWPQFSDAVVDYYYDKKKAYDFIKRSQQPMLLVFREPENGVLSLVAVNEFLVQKDVKYTVRDLATDTVVLSGEATVSANDGVVLGQVEFDENGVHFYLIEWEIDGESYKNHYLSGKPPYSFKQYLEWIKESGF